MNDPLSNIFYYNGKSYSIAEFKEWAPQQLRKLFPSFSDNLVIEDNIIYQNHSCFAQMKGSKILIVGGGPSTLTLTQNVVDRYDYVWSMNHCFKNKFLSGQVFDIIALGAGVNLKDYSLLSFLKEKRWAKRPLIGLEIHPNWEFQKDYINNEFYDSIFCWHSRLYGTTGVGIRLVNLAGSIRVGEAHFIGFDGPSAIFEGQHAFTPGKTRLPSLCTQANAVTLHQDHYDKQWSLLKFLYPETRFVSLQKNTLHRCLLN